MKKTNPLVVLGVALGLLFLFLLIGQVVGSLIFLKYGPLKNTSFSPFLLIKLWNLTSGKVLGLLIYKIAGGISLVLSLMLSILFAILLFKKPKRELHGSAKFANKVDLVKAKLLNPDKNPPDILIGQTMKGEYLRWSNKAFAYLAAPTRSGKGVGIVIPNCLHYRESLVVFDPKLENFKITSGYRKACGQEVYLFNPSTREGKSHRWNPLSYVRRDRLYTVGDAFNIANILYSTSASGAEGNTKFFNEMAQKLFVGLILYMIETEEQTGKTPTLTYLNQLTTPVGQDLSDWINQECENNLNLSDACKNNLLSYAQNSANTASGILSSLIAPLSAFIEPIVAAATSGDDFDLRDVRKKKMTIYVGISPNDFQKFERLINLFFSQLISVNTEELPEDNPTELKYQCLLLIDEFGAMGKVNVIQSGVAYIAGYNLRLLLIFQNMSQLNELYTVDGARTLSTNFDCQIIYPPRDHKDAQEFSEIVGYETVKSSSLTKDRAGMGSKSESVSDQKRALLLPQELTSMDDSECIISMRSMKPIHCKKIIYYEDPVFQKRINKPMPKVHHLGLTDEESNKDKLMSQMNALTQFTIVNCLPYYWSKEDRNTVAASIADSLQKDNEFSISDAINEILDNETENIIEKSA